MSVVRLTEGRDVPQSGLAAVPPGPGKLADPGCLCALQNSHDRETCARSLRATQESRPSPGAFPPAALCSALQQQPQQQRTSAGTQQRCCAMSQVQRNSTSGDSSNPRPHRPASLDIGTPRRCPLSCTRAASTSTPSPIAADHHLATPSSALASCTARGFFDDRAAGTADANSTNHVQSARNEPAGFELNVNVACSPAGNRGTHPRRSQAQPSLVRALIGFGGQRWGKFL